MKKAIITLFLIIIILVILITSIIVKIKKDYITDNEYLYELAITYLNDNNDDYYKDKENYNKFFNYKGFGITEDKKYKYVYMWILEESYFTSNGKLYSGSGSTMPYKFTFKDEKVVKYDIPKDGSEYESSIKNLFPSYISKKILNYNFEELNFVNREKIDEYYSFLESTEINYDAN